MERGSNPVRQILTAAKSIVLRAAHRVGVFETVRDSRWRQQRLVILGYHGISLEDEHEWNPGVYMSPARFESRLAVLERGGYTVLPLAEALTALYESRLPPRSVALTFDDGYYDFYVRVFPALKARALPATVYLTTYYCEYNRPIFRLVCSYMLWKARHIGSLNLRPLTGENRSLPLATAGGREAVVESVVAAAEREHLSGRQKDEFAAQLAALIGVDYAELCAKRILHLMNAAEVAELSRQSVDFQLHTHRHTLAQDGESLCREIRDNRVRIERLTSHRALHFCYPCGYYEHAFLPWLENEQVASATTCNPGLVSARSSRLLLPRFVDTEAVSATKFEGWLSGAAALLPGRRSYARVS
jgi:peptidoglycan/xylan/chitin deacetylase (PgdA/CDA1 family)